MKLERSFGIRLWRDLNARFRRTGDAILLSQLWGEQFNLCTLPATLGEVLAVTWGASLTLHQAPGWCEDQHWDTHAKKGRLAFLGTAFLCILARIRQCWCLALVSARSFWVSDKWIMEESLNSQPRSTPLLLVLQNILEMFLWWTGA